MIKKYLALTGIALSFSANAAIIDLGNITRDTDTGLDWLDVTATWGLTPTQVLAKMGSGGEYEGWRYATLTEVDQLISNFGYVPQNPCPTAGVTNCTANSNIGEAGDNPIIETMINTLGDTTAFEFTTFDYSNGAGATRGYAENNLDNFGDYTLAIIVDNEYCVGTGKYSCIDSNDYILINAGYSGNKGSFLVMGSPISAVPVPAAFWLFASAMIGFLGVRRKINS